MADSTAPPATTTCPAPISRRQISPVVVRPTNATPTTRPRPSTSSRSARVCSRICARPVAKARGSTVFCVPALGVGRAREPDTHPAALTRRPTAVRPRVDQQRHPDRAPAEPVCRLPQQVVPRSGTHRGHRVGPAPPGGLPVGRAGHAELVVGPGVVRLQVVVVDRPVGQGAPLGHAVGARHREVSWLEPPRLGAVDPRAATGRHRVVGPAGFVRSQLPSPPADLQHPQIMIITGSGQRQHTPVGTRVPQLVVTELADRGPRPGLHDQHLPPRLGEQAGRHPATRPRPDHHGVVTGRQPVRRDFHRWRLGDRHGP